MIKKILIGIGILVFVLIALAFFSIKAARSEPPPLLVADFVDLDKIEKISKYRSCAGHTTVPQDKREMKRSMKHYFEVKPQYHKNQTVEIYSPYDGYVTSLRSEPELHLEGEIWIIPKRKLPILPPFGVWHFSVQHIEVKKDLKMGSEVKAGELIGYAAFSEGRGSTFDIVYGKMGIPTKKIDNWTSPFSDLDSVFNHMGDEVFAKYRQKGLLQDKLILTKEQRDQNPCRYKGGGPYFENDKDFDNWVDLQ